MSDCVRIGWRAEADEHHRLPSKFGGFVTAALYYAERMTERYWLRVEKKELGPEFWNRKKEYDYYLKQAGTAKRLIALYGAAAVGAAVKRHVNNYSMLPKEFADKVKAEHDRLAMEYAARHAAGSQPSIEYPPVTSRPVFVAKQSVRSLLNTISPTEANPNARKPNPRHSMS